MKVRFKLNRRHNVYALLVACGSGLWLMVARFGLSTHDLLVFFAITVGLLVLLIGTAALAGFILGKMRGRDD